MPLFLIKDIGRREVSLEFIPKTPLYGRFEV